MDPHPVNMDLVAMLATHWIDHPSACDTPEGIRSWWVRAEWRVSHESVMAALGWLLNRGFIESVTAADGRVRFRRHERRRASEFDELVRHIRHDDGPCRGGD